MIAASFLRVAAISALGLAVDVALALVLRSALPLSLAVAGAISFVAVAVLNYFLFEFLAFRSEQSRASLKRLSQVLAGAGAALATRVAIVAAATALIGPDRSRAVDAAILVGAAGVSLLVNFAMLQYVTFRNR